MIAVFFIASKRRESNFILMIDVTPTFLYQLYEQYRGQPGNRDSRISIPVLTKTGKKITAVYAKKAFLPNSIFPAELYEYRRKVQVEFGIQGAFKSEFADNNLAKNTIYSDPVMKGKVSGLIDLCRQNMNSEFERELDDEINLLGTMDDDDNGKTLEYHYDLYETVKTFNDFLCITFLNLSNILTYPNESFYEKYLNKQIRIKPDDAIRMANRICSRMQKEFEDIIIENFPIRETVDRIEKAERVMPNFNSKDIVEEIGTTKVIKKAKAKATLEK